MVNLILRGKFSVCLCVDYDDGSFSGNDDSHIYHLAKKLNILNSMSALIIPFMVSGFGIFCVVNLRKAFRMIY